ncbi:RsmE family RNA methyltransferase [Corynebacterium pyruviciproducens ATCC BAA-1742]|uniref:Ribosomal RNA small subunit methyltransferase E n=1 Tax=Corynebacterium pyruviciproducens ATCC BAA-1742 TaxID=1125779 RepID=S3A076_9CORY|nr:16S rRNA (uracil(1498)-N(3))-methyltransferase [Corynebacterium pyruviciproducens]EPD69749.1 RsmE family RNA methyltransferase [Corynebacterium pyruviciproducens ATCC BAA-1742]MDK7214134.1 16S rRNA (uracil(1498)-N(3))-methyltransferase [Corynebacterium pyruviciproducens]
MTAATFVVDGAPAPGPFVLTGPEGRHAVTVKRMAIGETVWLVDGHGSRSTATVTRAEGKDNLHVEVTDRVELPPATPTVTVIQALPKSDRQELTVDLLTQGGADVIVPWEAERCIAKWQPKKAAKWENAAVAAAKQSRRARFPHIMKPNALDEALDGADLVLVLHEEAARPLSAVDFSGVKSVVLIVGPEGGLSPAEVERFTEAGAHPVLLGPEVLRTATAGFAALAAIGVKTSRWLVES